jgi:starch-binding outer membrane protein, SusD/RagB family
MKKLVIFISLIFLISCEDEYLNLSPVSELNTENFFVSAGDFNNALLAAYDVLQEKNKIDWIMNEIRSDNGTEAKDQDERDLDNFSVSTTNAVISNFWKICYKGIFRTNIILEKIEDADILTPQKNLIIGQTKFIRAYFYFDLVRYFGDVPLVTKVLKLSESYEAKRNPVNEVYQLIESDLKDAAMVLPSLYTGTDVGRVTKGAANAMLAKVYLTEKKYAEAKTVLEAVTSDTQAGYKLLPVFSDVFSVSNQNNLEIIFAIQYSNGTGDGNGFMNEFGPGTIGADVSPGVGSEHNWPTVDIIRAFEPGDTRKAVTLREYIVNPAKKDTVNNPYNRKFLANQLMNDSGVDWPILRYSDVILMYAEVLNELNDLPGAIAQLNKIRERAFGNQLHNFNTTSITTKEVFRTKVLNERRVELAFENHRWFDLLRTGKALEFLQVENRLADWKTGKMLISLEIKMQPFESLYPIPQDEIELSKGNLVQNEGY